MEYCDSRRIKEIRDNTAKMADAFTRIADALERLVDRKIENSSEKPNDCETVSTGYNLSPVDDEPQTDIHDLTDCDFCKDRNCKDCEGGKDEPQTEEHCETCRHKDECEGATYEYKNTEWWCLAYAPIDEPQTDCAWR